MATVIAARKNKDTLKAKPQPGIATRQLGHARAGIDLTTSNYLKQKYLNKLKYIASFSRATVPGMELNRSI